MSFALVGDVGIEPTCLATTGLQPARTPLFHTTHLKLADRFGIEPNSHGLTVRPHTDVRFGQ
jgi:hypothetical protein